MDDESRAVYDGIVAEMAASSPAVAGTMFGMPCVMAIGKAFAGYYQGAMAFKLGGAAHAAALSLSGARLFDSSGRGRPMKEWVEVPGAHSAQWDELAREALRYAGSATA